VKFTYASDLFISVVSSPNRPAKTNAAVLASSKEVCIDCVIRLLPMLDDSC
jgi:hypothetical protein